ncbi:putative inorganic phosphate cotransporter [Leptidea sinapis]|uniref:putative inorganic phosphate cotransporter n=1 Tax=Leptidea sinapis TaxID=189913 RepID=UPI00213F73DF|nr:putative inorganic phosphate cotransporter [Leptidea sinapis]
MAEPPHNAKPKGVGVRHLQTFLLFLGMLLAYSMRVNLSIAIVDMTDSTNEHYFKWSLSVQSLILSSFFWGYVVLQIPAGALARRIGGKPLMLGALTVNTAVSLLMPTLANIGGWQVVCACRVLQGLSQGFVFPSTHYLASQWIPLEEKGILTTIIYAGGQLGIGVQLVAAGFIAAAWGWPAIFYVNGALGIAWLLVYALYGSSSPEQSRHISAEELSYIQVSLGTGGKPKRHPVPWRRLATCLPFWAAVVAHGGQNWGFFTLMTEMPTYMAKVLNFKLTQNGLLSSLPYLVMYLLSFPMGMMTDLIIRRGWLSISNTRKLSNSIGLWGPALALIGLSYIPKGSMALAVVMLTVTVGMNAGQYTGYPLVFIDLAPNFSSVLMGTSNTIAGLISIIAPIVCGLIIQDESDPLEWRKVFFLASAIYFFSNLFFVLFTTSERRSWNEPTERSSSDIEKKGMEMTSSYKTTVAT